MTKICQCVDNDESTPLYHKSGECLECGGMMPSMVNKDTDVVFSWGKDEAEQYLETELTDEQWNKLRVPWRKEIGNILGMVGVGEMLQEVAEKQINWKVDNDTATSP